MFKSNKFSPREERKDVELFLRKQRVIVRGFQPIRGEKEAILNDVVNMEVT